MCARLRQMLTHKAREARPRRVRGFHLLRQEKPLTFVVRQLLAHKARNSRPRRIRYFHCLKTKKASDPCRAPSASPQSTRRAAKEGQRFSPARRISSVYNTNVYAGDASAQTLLYGLPLGAWEWSRGGVYRGQGENQTGWAGRESTRQEFQLVSYRMVRIDKTCLRINVNSQLRVSTNHVLAYIEHSQNIKAKPNTLLSSTDQLTSA